MKKALSIFCAAAMCTGILAGCGNTGSTAETTPAAPAESVQADSQAAETPAADAADNADNTAAGGVFKIGGTAPLTGAAAIYGNAVKNGAQIAVDEINAEGGAVQFDLKYEDDENDPEKAVSAYNALKDWGIQLSLGSVTTKPCEVLPQIILQTVSFP